MSGFWLLSQLTRLANESDVRFKPYNSVLGVIGSPGSGLNRVNESPSLVKAAPRSALILARAWLSAFSLVESSPVPPHSPAGSWPFEVVVCKGNEFDRFHTLQDFALS